MAISSPVQFFLIAYILRPSFGAHAFPEKLQSSIPKPEPGQEKVPGLKSGAIAVAVRHEPIGLIQTSASLQPDELRQC